MADLSIDFSDINLKNPLIAGPRPIISNVEMIIRLSDNGISAVVAKTGFIKKEYEK